MCNQNLLKNYKKNFFKNTSKKISVHLIRASKSIYNDTVPKSLAERKQIPQQIGHSLSTHMQYSKHVEVQRLINNPQQLQQQFKNQN